MLRIFSAALRLRVAVAALVSTGALLTGCASTSVTSVWRDPGVGPVQFKKVVGVVLSQDASLRRLAEDEFVRAVGPAVALAGYAVIPDDEIQDKEKARARVEAAGADGAVVFRLVGIEQQERWVPPTYYGNAWGYWGYAAPRVYDPGYLTTDRIVQVEAAAYAVPTARLVWAAHSHTLNPANAKQLVDEVVRAIVERMRKDGLLAAQ